LNFPGRDTPILPEWKDVFTRPVEVTSGRPCYNSSRGYKINARQTLADFFSRAFPSPVETQLRQDPRADKDRNSEGKYYSVAIKGRSSKDPLISFERTIRIPEDSRDYPLPPGIDSFPLYDIRQFSSKLPAEMVAQGGLFLPMYRE
jgi:hypothetical protein